LNKLPSFPEGERAIIGACLIDASCLPTVVSTVTVNDFFHRAHQDVFAVITELVKAEQAVDWTTLTDALRAKGKLEAVGGTTFLTDLADAVPSAANVKHYLEQVKEKARLRRLVWAGQEIMTSAGCLDACSSEIIEQIQKLAFDLVATGSSESRKLERVESLLPESLDYLNRETNPGVLSGLLDLDGILKGFQPGELTVIGARPSMGKSALALDIAVNAVHQVPVAMFSLEMSRNQLMNRLLSKQAKVNLHHIRPGGLSRDEWSRVWGVAGDFDGLPLYIDDSGSITMSQVKAKVREASVRSEEAIGLIIIDYLQLMRPEGRHDSRQNEVASMTRAAKLMAKDMEIPVIVLSQLNRKLEDRPIPNHGRRPQAADFKESGAIEQDADVMIAIYRGEVYMKDSADLKGKAEAIILKQRNGPTGIVNLQWDAPTATFRNAAREREECHGMEGEM